MPPLAPAVRLSPLAPAARLSEKALLGDARLRLASYMLRTLEGVVSGMSVGGAPALAACTTAIVSTRVVGIGPLHMCRYTHKLYSVEPSTAAGRLDQTQLVAMLGYYPIAAAGLLVRAVGTVASQPWLPIEAALFKRLSCLLWLLFIGAQTGATAMELRHERASDAKLLRGRLAKLSLDSALAANWALPGAAELSQLTIGIVGTLSSSLHLWLISLGQPSSRRLKTEIGLVPATSARERRHERRLRRYR